MIPRLKPFLGAEEMRALLHPAANAVEQFESDFASTFGAKHGIAFGYGRAALNALLRAVGVEQAEVVLPAYTCSVVGHAVVLSGNAPRFVDSTLADYNMDLEMFESAINERTRMVVPTHLFGYPMDVDRITAIVRAAEQRYGTKIWIVQDCAHSFGARWKGRLVSAEPDVALFGLNISKSITSIFGGMLVTNNAELAAQLRDWRDRHYRPASAQKALQRRLYLMAVYAAFNPTVYRAVEWLQSETPLLDGLTKAYHLDEKIEFPPDASDRMLPVEASVGLAQLGKYEEIIARRRDTAHFYAAELAGVGGLELPPLIEGATYSHYVIRSARRDDILEAARKRGVELGQLIEYVVPQLKGYEQYAAGQQFPVAEYCSRTAINLPVHASVDHRQRQQVAEVVKDAARTFSHYPEKQLR